MAASADQPTLVLLHGLLGDADDWRPVIAALPEIECHALDLPGHGRSKGLRVSGFEQAHEWLCEELAARGIEHYRLAGYSLGGRLALYHASQSPAGLQAILLENCHPGLPEAERAARTVRQQDLREVTYTVDTSEGAHTVYAAVRAVGDDRFTITLVAPPGDTFDALRTDVLPTVGEGPCA